MKVYSCTNCNNSLYFENATCLNCNHVIGFDADNFKMIPLENTANGYAAIGDNSNIYRFCNNVAHGTCNWLIPVTQVSPFCLACSLNRTIPALISAVNNEKWQKIEIAKHRLVYSLLKLNLPVAPKKSITDTTGIAFDFMADASPSEKVLTGHDNGVITLNIEEADEAQRTRHQLDMGEKYRTLLGHFRHEIGHYYWDVLIRDSSHLQKFNSLFGDANADYTQALETYYKTPTPVNWNDKFISPYATAHPWEDWAETWAHYMHLMDTLETAYSFGINIRRKDMATTVSSDPYTIENFDEILDMWFPLTFAVNSLNRSMGHGDFYPFIVSVPVVNKLKFIHEVCRVGKN